MTDCRRVSCILRRNTLPYFANCGELLSRYRKANFRDDIGARLTQASSSREREGESGIRSRRLVVAVCISGTAMPPHPSVNCLFGMSSVMLIRAYLTAITLSLRTATNIRLIHHCRPQIASRGSSAVWPNERHIHVYDIYTGISFNWHAKEFNYGTKKYRWLLPFRFRGILFIRKIDTSR